MDGYRSRVQFFLKLVLLTSALYVSFVFGSFTTPSKWVLALSQRLFSSHKQVYFSVKEHKPFVIVVPSYNNAEWVEKNLGSIVCQKYDNFRVIYVNDASTDNTLERVNDFIIQHQMAHRFDVVNNEVNKGGCENIYRAVNSCCDDEIVLLLDGDDWLAHDGVLARLNEIYANPSTWITYGSYIEYPTYGYTVANFAKKLPDTVVENNTVRNHTRKQWCLSHLRTFYAGLFKKIAIEDLQWDGKFFDASSDIAFMIPMVEMAGKHAKYLDEIFYIYNRATPLNDNKVRSKRQLQLTEHILDLPPYIPQSKLLTGVLSDEP
jgi:glycosyltransferase involved in cell wall biosynthesis